MIKQKLNNGLRVVYEQIPSFRSVAFGIWIKAGSRNESVHDNGISHFIEHMLFKGTKRYSAHDFAAIFDGIGGNINAFTTKEYTCFYAKVLDEHLPIAVDALSDMFFNSLLQEEDMIKERNVILEEIAMYEDTPDDYVHDLISKAAYGEHPLGYPILGSESNLLNMNRTQLQQYLDCFYNINNTVISLAGHLNDDVVSMMNKHFGQFSNFKDETRYSPPKFIGDVHSLEKKTEQNHLCLALPGYSMEDDLIHAMILLNNVIGGGMSSRLFQEIRERRGLAYSVYSYHSSHADSGMFTIYAGTSPRQTEEVLNVMMDVLADLLQNGITEEELSRGKEQLKGSLILSLESTSSRMSRLGKYELMLGSHFTIDELIARIENVQMAHIDTVLKQLFSQPFAVAMVGEGSAIIERFRRDQLVIHSTN